MFIVVVVYCVLMCFITYLKSNGDEGPVIFGRLQFGLNGQLHEISVLMISASSECS